MSKEELRIERMKYHILLDNDINSMTFNDNIHNKIINFIIFTVALNAIFCYAGLSAESNINVILDKYDIRDSVKLLFIIIPSIIQLIYVISLAVSTTNKKSKLYIQSLILQFKQIEFFKGFIKKEIEKKEGQIIENIIQLSEIISRNNIYDINFNEIEFENYIIESLKKYKIKFPLSFEANYSKFILLNQCIEGILIQNKSNVSTEYTLIIDKNFNIL